MSELNKAEKYLLENLTRLAEEGCVDENPRPKWEDGKPAHSIYITPVFETYDISKGETPITETRPIYFKKAIGEIKWIYSDQSNNLSVLRDKYGIKWWDDFEVDGTNSIGVRYGETVRIHNLLDNLLKGLEEDKYSRRHVMSLWQVEDFKLSGGLLPCFFMTTFTVRKVNGIEYLDMTLHSRSNDYLVAGFVNRIQYLALQMMIAKHLSLEVGKFNIYVQNLHIYDRHVEQAEETVKRITELRKRDTQSQPRLILNVPDGTNFHDINVDDFELINYEPIKPQLKFEVAV